MHIFNQKGIALPLIILIVVTLVGFTAFKFVKKTPKTTPDTQQTMVEDVDSLENEMKQLETEVSQIEQTEEVFAKTLDEAGTGNQPTQSPAPSLTPQPTATPSPEPTLAPTSSPVSSPTSVPLKNEEKRQRIAQQLNKLAEERLRRLNGALEKEKSVLSRIEAYLNSKFDKSSPELEPINKLIVDTKTLIDSTTAILSDIEGKKQEADSKEDVKYLKDQFKKATKNIVQIKNNLIEMIRMIKKLKIPTPQPTSSTTPSPIVGGGAEQYGVNTGIMVPEEPYFNDAMDQADSLGVGWIRLGSDWVDLEPKDNQWNFSESDKYIDTARAKGLNVVYTFDPDLNGKFCTMSPSQVSLGKVPQCSDEQFKDYISQIVTRYKGKVMYYELGNEPDLRRTWRDNPHEYARALSLAYPTLKTADPNAKLLLGGLALGGGQSSSTKWVQDFLNDKDNPPLNNFDIMNYHTYDKKEGITKQFNDVKSRVGNKPIWVTEVGYPSDPNEQQRNRGSYGYPAGEDGQAAYLSDILPHLLSLGVEKVFWYSLVDVPRDPQYFCTYSLTYISGKQCLGDSAGRTTGGELKTKKAFETYKSLTQ